MGRMKKKPPKRQITRHDTGETITAQDLVDFDCPFCGGHVSIAEQSSNSENVMGMHSLPMCDKFRDEDLLVYLRNARVAMVGPQPDDDEWPVPNINPGAKGNN